MIFRSILVEPRLERSVSLAGRVTFIESLEDSSRASVGRIRGLYPEASENSNQNEKSILLIFLAFRGESLLAFCPLFFLPLFHID